MTKQSLFHRPHAFTVASFRLRATNAVKSLSRDMYSKYACVRACVRACGITQRFISQRARQTYGTSCCFVLRFFDRVKSNSALTVSRKTMPGVVLYGHLMYKRVKRRRTCPHRPSPFGLQHSPLTIHHPSFASNPSLPHAPPPLPSATSSRNPIPAPEGQHHQHGGA